MCNMNTVVAVMTMLLGTKMTLCVCEQVSHEGPGPILEMAHVDKNSSRQLVIDGLLHGYDPRIPPNFEEDFPVTVTVQLHILSIDSISESNMDCSLAMFLRQTWNDSRLVYKKIPRLRAIELDSRLMDNIWVPDLFITNEKQAHFHMVTVPNKLMHIYPNGRVQYSLRISATVNCNMDLRKYPMDTQNCHIMMESYGYSTENVIFEWNHLPVTVTENLVLSQYYLGDMKTVRCDKQYYEVNYTCIVMVFKLTRNFGYYLTQVYIPSILIVILSWVSFWLDIDATPARCSLGLLTVLTMTTQSTGARAALPKVSYIKSIDIWMAACLFFVFASLIEFSYINVLSRVEKRRRNTIINLSVRLPDEEAFVQSSEKGSRNETKKHNFNLFTPNRENARTVDRVSRIVFPSVFIVFNIVYWKK